MRFGSVVSAAFLVLWIVASTVVSAVFTVRYIGIVEAIAPKTLSS